MCKRPVSFSPGGRAVLDLRDLCRLRPIDQGPLSPTRGGPDQVDSADGKKVMVDL